MAVLLMVLAACGGGGSASGAYSDAVEALANQCAPDNPFVRDAQGQPSVPFRPGSRMHELRFMRAYLNEAYLWRDEMPAVDPDAPVFQQEPFAQGLLNYFQASLSPALTPGGQRKDRFSSFWATGYWKAVGEAGKALNFGIEFVRTTAIAPLDIRAALVHDGSPAGKAGVLRGERLLQIETVDGRRIDVVNATAEADLALMTQLLAPNVPEQRVVMVFEKADGSHRRVTLASTQYVEPPVSAMRVLTAADGAKVGYLFINAFALPLEGAMQKAFERLKAEGVRDLVVDLRYNGGGYVYQASQLAYMVADPALSKGRIFERLQYNSLRQADTDADGSRVSFQGTTSGGRGTGTAAGQALPSLGLKRVYVLTGPGTCSSSESFINGLRGIDVEVVMIGGTTCGKPFGSMPRENCGLTYLPIEFTGYNDKGQGDYVDGIEPTCKVADVFGKGTHTLGDPKERLLSVALLHRQTGQCGAVTLAGASGGGSTKGVEGSAGDGQDASGAGAWLVRPPIRQNRIWQEPR